MANYVTGTSDKKKGTALLLCCLGYIGIGEFITSMLVDMGKAYCIYLPEDCSSLEPLQIR